MARLTPTPSADSIEPPVVEVRGHRRSFGDQVVLDGVDLELQPGEFVALLGRSGCGKSPLLRSLARLDPVPAGEVTVRGRSAVAFQEPRLLPWRSAHENVALALLNSPDRVARAARRERARDTLAEVGLGARLDAWPRELSGGQAQRVSLARALVSDPALLLLDEPFSALDALTRMEMHQLVIDLWRRHRMAVLIVTHDVDEALALADRVLVMEHGRIEHRFEITSRRDDRDHTNPEIGRIRTEVLRAVGVEPTPPRTQRAGDPTSTTPGGEGRHRASTGAA
ncbi:ABC transporter ATP-binding protein [Nocardioides sp.]|uniref:ABC transporter ATP-binding protein n=1 Tax=Nocardioides sp. TaxID=35761 RepID=UPI003513ADBD